MEFTATGNLAGGPETAAALGVGEDAHNMGPALDLLVQALKHVG